MSRKECKYGWCCGSELCPLEDFDVDCDEYEFSGYIRRYMTPSNAEKHLHLAEEELANLTATKITFDNGMELIKSIKRIKSRIAKYNRILRSA